MTFLETLEDMMKKRFAIDRNGNMEDGLEEILDVFKEYGEYLNEIQEDEFEYYYDLTEIIYDYHTSKRNYEDFKNGETYMLFPKRDNKTTSGTTKIKQDIKALRKVRELLNYIDSKEFRIMQGSTVCRGTGKNTYIPEAPIEWQEIDGEKKYKELIEYYNEDKECFTGSHYRNIALKAFDETIQLYEDSEKFIFADEYRVRKDIFHCYWFISCLIGDLETQSFELFERTEYYNPEKSTKTDIKNYLKFLREKYKLKTSLDEKQLIDAL